MAVEFDGGVVIGADSRTTTGYGKLSQILRNKLSAGVYNV